MVRLLLVVSGIWLLSPFTTRAQWKSYAHQHQLNGVSQKWHKIILPDSLFAHVREDFYDIRVYGTTDNTSDTLEAPYLLRSGKQEVSFEEVDCRLINPTKKDGKYFYTLEVPTEETVNVLDLDFQRTNFDVRIRLEGSQDQQEWFVLQENYRLVSIENALTRYRFTTLRFPEAKYRYFRLEVSAEEDPRLEKATLRLRHVKEGTYKAYPIQQSDVREQEKRTEIHLTLAYTAALSRLRLLPTDSFAYYRPIQIEALTDSFQTEKGWKYRYKTLFSGTLTSLEPPVFYFRQTLARKIRVRIENQDNQPLTISGAEVEGYQNYLVARFLEPERKYYLVYGKPDGRAPRYDIRQFEQQIPSELKALSVGAPTAIEKTKKVKKKPLFENEWSLWVILILLISLLGAFSLRMMSQKQKEEN